MSKLSDAERSFLEGRDLAVELLRSRRSHENTSVEARHRDGKAQDNWAVPYFAALGAQPELLEGFCAVLSDFLSDCGGTDAEVFERLTLGEMLGARRDHAFARFMTAASGGENV